MPDMLISISQYTYNCINLLLFLHRCRGTHFAFITENGRMRERKKEKEKNLKNKEREGERKRGRKKERKKERKGKKENANRV
jgi:hypothetical protein